MTATTTATSVAVGAAAARTVSPGSTYGRCASAQPHQRGDRRRRREPGPSSRRRHTSTSVAMPASTETIAAASPARE